MARFLATLHSTLSKRAGIGIVDSEYGLIYLQVETLPFWIASPQLRAMAHYEDELYITSPASVLGYSVESDLGKPFFQLQKTITLPEWVLGANMQADLLGILISSTRKQLLVANNLFNAVDELNLEGEFIKRHFLHNIAPDLFPIPETVSQSYQYGHIRSITKTAGGTVFLTISTMHGTDEGCVINFDTGEVFLGNLEKPHGGCLCGDTYLILEVSKGLLSAYPVDSEGNIVDDKIWETKPKINIPLFADSVQNMRGMLCVSESIYCGVLHWGKGNPKQIPARIVSFDKYSGRQQTTEIFFPDTEEFREPRVFTLAPLPSSLAEVEIEEFMFYLDGEIWKKKSKPVVKLKQIAKEQPETTKVSQKPAVILENVSLAYPRSNTSVFSFKKGTYAKDDFTALNNVSFTLYEGETVGIIGRNGSGKSTVSMLISGALPPDKGSLETIGRVQLLSIGLGFQNERSGRDNVFINGALLGLSKKEILKKMPAIENFAELENFLDEPVRTYSAGMKSRLGFAVATAVSPDILILDEVMSTGDAAFRKKADERMLAMRERTKTIIVVSHSINQVKKMCTRVIWFNEGMVVMDGTPEEVCSEYTAFCEKPQKLMPK
ncbi:MAG: ABC transporter ATP-binding protein [Desulfocapsa sp.]|nr:ABC transporter ATP-binding protein [Desulfocapsa sp.]